MMVSGEGMTIFDEMTKDQLKEFLIKNWMTHDGAWFFYTFMELGIDKANHFNKSAIKMLADAEVKRLLKLMGWQGRKITTFEDIKTFITTGRAVLVGDFMDFNITFPDKNVMHWAMNNCWAYEGMKKLGVEKEYDCGVLWRVTCWLKNIGVKFEMEPHIKTCQMSTQGKCEGDFRFFLD